MSDPTTMNLVGPDAIDPRLNSTWKPGRLGHLGLVGKGLVAMYPMSPSLRCGKTRNHGARRMPWSTKL